MQPAMLFQGEMTEQLILDGVDIVKVGVEAGSVKYRDGWLASASHSSRPLSGARTPHTV